MGTRTKGTHFVEPEGIPGGDANEVAEPAVRAGKVSTLKRGEREGETHLWLASWAMTDTLGEIKREVSVCEEVANTKTKRGRTLIDHPLLTPE